MPNLKVMYAAIVFSCGSASAAGQLVCAVGEHADSFSFITHALTSKSVFSSMHLRQPPSASILGQTKDSPSLTFRAGQYGGKVNLSNGVHLKRRGNSNPPSLHIQTVPNITPTTNLKLLLLLLYRHTTPYAFIHWSSADRPCAYKVPEVAPAI